MPVMDGVQLVGALRSLDQDAAVIVLTGAPEIRTAIECLKLGASDFIMKPVNIEELLIASDRALERRQLLIERRQYQELLERRATCSSPIVSSRTPIGRPSSHWARRSTRATSAPSRTRAASTATRWPPPTLTACRRTSWPTSPTASCSTTSARSGFPTRYCSSPGR